MAELFVTAYNKKGEKVVDKMKVKNFHCAYLNAEANKAFSIIIHRQSGRPLERATFTETGKWFVNEPAK